MAEVQENIVLEHLRHITGKVDRTETEVLELKSRVSSLEEGIGQTHVQLVQMGQLTGRMDRFDQRLTRIENRLDLNETPNPAAE